MAAAISALSLLLISLLSFSTTETVATFINPLTIPSCTGHPAMLKCAHDIQSAIVGAGSVGIGTGSHTISLLLDSIITAKSSYANVLHFLSSNHIKADLSVSLDSLHSAIHIAIQELNQASKVLHGKTTLSTSEFHNVQKFLKVANQNLTKSIACLKHPNSNINLSLRSLIDQSINLTVLSLKIFAQLSAKVSVGLIH